MNPSFTLYRRASCLLLLAMLTLVPIRGEAAGIKNIAVQWKSAAHSEVPQILFEDEHGQTLDLQTLRGHPILLNLWAVWCAPCVREMPSLNALAKSSLGKRLKIIALSEDNDGIAKSRVFFHQHSIDALGVYADNAGRAPSVLGIRGMPTTILIDAKGNEIGRVDGEVDWASDETMVFLAALLN